MFRSSCGFLRCFIRPRARSTSTSLRTKTCLPSVTARFFTDSSKDQKDYEESEDFFGVPSGYKLQHARMERVDGVDIEEQYFGNCQTPGDVGRPRTDDKAISSSNSGHSVTIPGGTQSTEMSDRGTNIFEEQYFGDVMELEHQKSNRQATLNTDSVPSSPDLDLEINFIEEQYFGTNQPVSDVQSLNNIYNGPNDSDSRDNLPHVMSKIDSSQEHLPSYRSISSQSAQNHTDPVRLKSTNLRNKPRPRVSLNTLNQSFGSSANNHQEMDLQEPITAHDIAVKVRKELNNSGSTAVSDSDIFMRDLSLTSDRGSKDEETKERFGKKRDSKGFHILSDQLLDLGKMTTSDILLMLRKKIIFDHDDFLAINKPYGLASFDNNSDRLSLNTLLPRLCEVLPPKYKVSNLHLVQGLDKDVTGAVILAKNEQSAHLLKGMFDANEIKQRFWAITKGVPNPRTGIIDIPVGEAKVSNLYKMVLRPLYSKDPQFGRRTSKSQSYDAVTEFNVLASHAEAALVECQPGRKLIRHQLRVHLSNGLNTPILGDHKYSHFSKMAPQKLGRTALELLHIRQAKVRHLALHLHCHTLVIPHFKSKMVIIPARLPPHFSRNMKSLKLSVKGL